MITQTRETTHPHIGAMYFASVVTKRFPVGAFYVVALVSAVGCAVVTPPKNVTVLVDGLSGFIQCVLEQGDSVTWLDTTEFPSVAIFGGNPGSDNIERGHAAGPGTKYENLYIDSPSGCGIFNLNIANAEFMDDEGEYTCQPLLSSGAASTVSIEVPTVQVTLSCESCNGDNTESTCQCTCLAEEGYPSSLTIGWATTAGSIGTGSMEPAVERNGKYDFTGTADVTITENMAVITCSVTGYVNQGVVEENFSDRVSQEQVLVSPTDCLLNLKKTGESLEGDCIIQLNCSCQGVPPINSCMFYSGTQDNEISDKDSCFTNHQVQMGTEGIFLCSGSNGINFVRDISDPVSYECLKSSRKSSSLGLIVICCIEGAVIIAMIFVIGFLYSIKKGWRKENAPNQLHDTTNNANSAYMNLQDTKISSPNSTNADVPYENLVLREPLPGKGLVIYQRAQMITVSKREEIVVKTVSDDSPVRLEKLQADEIRLLSALASNVNVVQFFGCCHKVPGLLCFEFVNGNNLVKYLEENFQRSKIHQYGNTKQKRFHVAEKGSVEVLPHFALQIARGMKFLTTHKFLHPGLRSEKVIINVSGECKLYDFVSKDNAKEIIAILWGKSVPYQWMPPEYLFLEKLDPTVDVWSFGVVLWEIFSYGAKPYEGKSRSDVEKRFREKEFLEIPNNCPGAIWQIVLNCWEQSPEKRPSFDHLYVQLSHMCNENKEYDEIHSK